MALMINATTSIGTGAAALSSGAGVGSGLRQASARSVQLRNAVSPTFQRASPSLVVRAEGEAEPGPAGRSSAPTSPMSTPPGSDEFPLGVISSTAPLEQGSDKPVGERIAYVCQDCGYVYDGETPFEDVSDEYNCPQCAAPKARFSMANATVGEMVDTTEEDDAVSRGSGVKSGSSPTSQN